MSYEEFKEKCKGILCLLITPFKEDGEIDYEGLRENVNRIIEAGVHMLIPCGSTGEFSEMTLEERKKVVETVIDEANGRVPVVAGTAHSSARVALELTRHAEDAGADGAMITYPYYFSYPGYPEEGLYNYYKTICDGTELPIMLYNKPVMVVGRVSLQTLERLAELENVVAMKDVTFDPFYFSMVVRRLGDRLAIVPWTVGSYALWAFQLGCPGTTATIPNFAPEASVEFYEAYVKGDLERAWELARLFDLFHDLWRSALARFGGPQFINYSKKAMELLGMPSGPVRETIRVEIPEGDVERLKGILRKLGLLDG